MVVMTAQATPTYDPAMDSPRAFLPHSVDGWTVADLGRLPDDGLQYELLDGVLIVSPAPIPRHQGAIGELFVLLRAACPDEFKVFFAPLDWQPDRRNSLQPDLLVVRRDLIGEINLTDRLELAVEVLSPSTRRKDLVLKYSKYQDQGVPSYWVVDPVEPSITAWDLVDGVYQPAGRASGTESVTLRHPFDLTVVPADLV